MPFSKEDLWKNSIHISYKNDVLIKSSPSSVKKIKKKLIPIDGNEYQCGGIIKLNNGQEYRASFSINTKASSYLILSSILICINDVWYYLHEQEFRHIMNDN